MDPQHPKFSNLTLIHPRGEAKKMGGIEYLLDLNQKHSAEFQRSTLERRRYRAIHPTEIGFMKCMDGRLHGPVMTRTTLGIIQPFRNIGGRFDLGWFGFAHLIKEWVDYAVTKGRNCLVFTTYHYSRSNPHRGCAGFNYDTEAAIASSLKLRQQFERVFRRDGVFPIQCGIETDLDALVLHGENGEIIDLSEITNPSPEVVSATLERLYPYIPSRVLGDIAPLVMGNISHIESIRRSKRPLEYTEHREWVIGVGRGFDWLHEPNTALIIGPFDPDRRNAIKTAALVIKKNIEDGKVGNKDVVLITSAPYRDPVGPDAPLAVEKAVELQEAATEVIYNEVPDLIPHIKHLTTTVDMNTRALNVIDRK